MVKIASKREHWYGIQRIPESVDGYDWAPFQFVYRVWRWRGHIIWMKCLARRQLDQYDVIRRAFN